MKHYFVLLASRKIINNQILEEKRSLHRKLVESNRKIFKSLDLMILLCVLFNFGALIITNLLVINETPGIELMEVNAFQAKSNDFKLHPDATKIMFSLFRQLVLWFMGILCYVYYRMTVFRRWGLIVMITLTGLYTFFLGYDFFNDLSMLLGKLLWG